MADNYLERRMDDYRSGRLAAPARPSASRRPKEGSVVLPFAPSDILVAGDTLSDVAEAIMSALVAARCRVCFTAPDEQARAGNLAAQRSGAMFIPSSAIRRLPELRPEGFGAEITVGDTTVILGPGKTVEFTASTPAATVARAVLCLLTFPASTAIVRLE